jgi:UDP-glucose:(heptosyl)LPS alpha-1,3-glucosyltransferase
LKLASVIERLEEWRGGAETSTLELARLLGGYGHDVHIVTSTISQSPPGLTIHQVKAGGLLHPLRTSGFIHQATAFLREHPFDLVLAIAPYPKADIYQPRGGLLGETMARNVATRSSASRRLLKRALLAMNVKQRSLLDLERQVMRKDGPTIVGVSQYVARQCEELYGLTAPRVRVIFNGVNTQLPTAEERARDRAAIRAQYKVDDSTLLLLFVGHNFRLKGLIPLIETASRLSTSGFKNFKLLIVGRDNPVRYLRQIHARGLDERITFTGPTQRAAAFYFAADVCVHPTYYDPCSRVVLEALSYGLPCITTSFNGASEVMTEGREGFIIRTPDEVGLWARRIEELASAELRSRMSASALQLRERLSMARHVRELHDLLLETAVRKRSHVRPA